MIVDSCLKKSLFTLDVTKKINLDTEKKLCFENFGLTFVQKYPKLVERAMTKELLFAAKYHHLNWGLM